MYLLAITPENVMIMIIIILAKTIHYPREHSELQCNGRSVQLVTNQTLSPQQQLNNIIFSWVMATLKVSIAPGKRSLKLDWGKPLIAV